MREPELSPPSLPSDGWQGPWKVPVWDVTYPGPALLLFRPQEILIPYFPPTSCLPELKANFFFMPQGCFPPKFFFVAVAMATKNSAVLYFLGPQDVGDSEGLEK